MWMQTLPQLHFLGTTLSETKGAKTNTPSKTNTYKHLPIADTLLSLIIPHGVGVSMPMECMVLGFSFFYFFETIEPFT